MEMFNLNHKKDIKIYTELFKEIIYKKDFVRGEDIKKFENKFSNIIGTKYGIACNSGSDALYAIIKALDISKGDEVITSSHSWISTAEAIIRTGAKPVFVDTKEDFNINADHIKKKITKKTKALLIVHLYGYPCDMDKIIKICKEKNILLIEDCAQAHFSKYNGKNVGSFGIASAFSFFPTKNLGCFGDAGCVLTNSKILEKKIRMIFNHGSLNKKDFFFSGINSRMDTLQAKILTYKLKNIKAEIKYRKNIFQIYLKNLKNIKDIKIPNIPKIKKPFYYLMTILVNKKRNKLKQYLEKNGLKTGIYYHKPLPYLKVFKKINKKKNEFEKTIDNHKKMLSLPIHSGVRLKDVEICCNLIKKFYRIN